MVLFIHAADFSIGLVIVKINDNLSTEQVIVECRIFFTSEKKETKIFRITLFCREM